MVITLLLLGCGLAGDVEQTPWSSSPLKSSIPLPSRGADSIYGTVLAEGETLTDDAQAGSHHGGKTGGLVVERGGT